MVTPREPPYFRKIWLGREREMAELEGGLDELCAGRGGLFLITGEPGIGKTRLADELARRAAQRTIAVHWGRVWEAGGAPSYWPFTQVLRSLSRRLESPPSNVPSLERAAPLGGGDRFELFDAVNGFLNEVAERAPQLIVLDDLHAADLPSLLLLSFVVRDRVARALMIVGTYREAEARASPEVAQALAQIAREACLLPLRRLDPDEVAAFVAQATGQSASPERLAELHRQTEGNPLFLNEILQLSRGATRAAHGIREVVRARLSLLAPEARRVLEAASVIGREFDVELLAAIAESPERELGAALEPAGTAGIVEALGYGARWRFTHVLLREGLYESLEPARRSALHHAVARELGRRSAPSAPAELAHHLLNAVGSADVEQAARAALLAAERALDVLAFEDACSLLDRARALLDGAPSMQRLLAEVLLALGIARMRLAEIALGKQTCRRAAELARELDDGELFARAALGASYEYIPGIREPDVIAMLEEALTRLPQGDSALRARCLAQLAAERQPEPDTLPAMELARSAIEMARRLGDEATLRFTLVTANFALLPYADPEERIATNQEALRLGLAAGDRLTVLRAHLFLQSALSERGDFAGALAHIRAHAQLAGQFRHSRFRWIHTLLEVPRALWEGRFEDAERIYSRALELGSQDEARGVTALAFPVGYLRAAERFDDLPEVESQLRAAFGALGPGLPSCIGEMLIAQLYGRAGDRQRARAQLDAVLAHPVFGQIREPVWLTLLVEPVHLVADVALAERLYPALLPRERRFAVLGPLGAYMDMPFARDLGLLAETLGRLDDAVRHLELARAMMIDAEQRSQLARVEFELGRVLLSRGAAADRARAAELFERARSLAEQLGQQALCRAIASFGTVRPEPRPEASFSLRREGDYWTIEWAGESLRLRDSRGLRLLDQLVAHRGSELHVLTLLSAAEPAADGCADAGDAGEALDAEAVHSYRLRITELRSELDEAERFADVGRAERARREIDFLTRELSRAVGLGGRERRTGAAAERARTAVQKRLRDAIRRIEDGMPALGRHLDQAIHTGTFCGYFPDGRARR